MAEINIHIVDGSIVSVDSEGGDDTDFEQFSGSGDGGDEFSTTPDPPMYTTTSFESKTPLKDSSTSPKTDTLPFIVGAIVGVLLLILLVTLFIVCLRRSRKAKSKKSTAATANYKGGAGPSSQGACGEGYSVAIALNSNAQDLPVEFAPPPPVPPSAPPPMAPHMPSTSSGKARYTPLGGRKGAAAAVTTSPEEDEKNSLYDCIDETEVDPNEYETAKPVPPAHGAGRQRIISSVTEDPNMGSETDKMLPTKV